MIRKVLTYPENKEILTQKSEYVDDVSHVQDLIQDLKDTLHSIEYSVGISAVQIGVLKRVCVIHYNGKDIVLINPVITKTRGEQDGQEGCLSVPYKFSNFKRPQKVWVNYIDENGRERELAEGGFMSRVVCHELDHFEGECVVFSLAEEEQPLEHVIL